MNFHRSPAAYIGHVHLIVANIDKSLDFYHELLGLELLERDGNVAFLGAGKSKLIVLEENREASPRGQRTTGLFHFALLLPTRKDLAVILQHLIINRYPLQGASDHLFSEAIYLSDPEGNGIEIYRDLTAEKWIWNGEELPLVSNPINLEKLLEEADGEHWTGFPHETVMGHIHLNVSNLQKEREFYVDGLGFGITIPFRHQALFISSEGYHHHIGLNTWQGEGALVPAKNSLGMKSYSIVLPSQEERDRIKDKLESLGYHVSVKGDVFWTQDHSENKIQLLVE